MSEIRIQRACEADVPQIRAMIHGLAVYAKLEHVMTATEEQLRETLFGALALFLWMLASSRRGGGEVIDPDDARQIGTLVGAEFEVQGVRFVGTEECKPCYWMDSALGPGAENWLKGRGGLRAAGGFPSGLRRGAALVPR